METLRRRLVPDTYAELAYMIRMFDSEFMPVYPAGMANGDERSYLPIALLCSLSEDDELYPPQETENRQLNYAIAGKGVFSLMRRAVETRARMPGSALSGKSLERFFWSPAPHAQYLKYGRPC